MFKHVCDKYRCHRVHLCREFDDYHVVLFSLYKLTVMITTSLLFIVQFAKSWVLLFVFYNFVMRVDD